MNIETVHLQISSDKFPVHHEVKEKILGLLLEHKHLRWSQVFVHKILQGILDTQQQVLRTLTSYGQPTEHQGLIVSELERLKERVPREDPERFQGYAELWIP